MSVFNQRFAEYCPIPQGITPFKGNMVAKLFCFCILLVKGQLGFTQDLNCNTSGLVCNNNLQISISYDCTLDLNIDRFIENPIEGAEYLIQFFDHHKRPIPELTEKEIGDAITYSVSCGGNTCSGHVILESNHLPVFDAPCQVREGQLVPPQCRTWCGTDIPSVFIDLKEMYRQMDDMCLPQFLGDIKQTLVREGDICSPEGEMVSLIHEVKVLSHGTLKVVELLRQSVIQQKIDLDTSSVNPVNSIAYPENLMLNCDEGFTPEELLLSDHHYHEAYPIYIDKHNLVPDSVFRCDTFVLETIIGFRDTVIATDSIDGVLVWEELTVVDKTFEDSIVCAYQQILNPDSTVVLVPNQVPLENRLCNIAAAYSDVEYNACGSGKKIIRHWIIIDWCDANIELSDPQTIEVTDTEKPVILEEITEMDIVIEPWACSARGRLPAIIAEDNCGEVIVEWYTDEGIINNGIISELWIQNSPIILSVYVGDACDNVDTMEIEINIIDDTPPVAICNTSMQIVLTGSNVYEFDNGTAKLWAEDFDEGSHDAQCGEVEFFVVRAEDWSVPVTNCDGEFVGFSPQSCSAKTEIVDIGELNSKQCEYTGKNRRPFVTKPAEFVKFCCEDANKFIDVIFIAQDKAGNTNECLVTILVENTNGPELVCEDVTITCEEDLHSVKRPELLDGDVCPVAFLPIQFVAESVNRSNCDSIIVTREWYVDANSDEEFGAGDPHCIQNITVTDIENEVEFICEDLTLPCDIDIDSIPIPKIAGNEFCICDVSLVKIGSFRYLDNNRCDQDTLIVEWYFDSDGNNSPSTIEPGCTQRIALTTDPNTFVIDCQPVTISCSETFADAARPTLTGQGDNCVCPIEFLKTEFVGQASDNCEGEIVQRSWYIDSNQNDRREDTEPSCIQDVTIDYSQVSYDLRCTNIELTCDDDPNLFFDEPEIVRIDVCDCPDPLVFLLEESRSNNECAVDTISRKWFLDVNRNETYDIEEPKCEQFLFINNLASPVNIICEDANIDCLDQLSGLFIPIVENQNSCGCTGNQLELRNQTSLDGLCYGDVITREWYVDINLNNSFDNNEPFCIQNLTLTTPEESPIQNDAMTFDCTPISVTCINDIDNVQAPALFSSGLCQCDDVSVNLNSNSLTLENICVGDTIFREWYADINNNNFFNREEPSCNQALIIVGSPTTNIVCTDQVIACTDALNSIPVPRVDQDGFCRCDNIQPSLLSESSIDDLCVGDNITRMWYLDLNQNGTSEEDEPFCEQTISIQDVFPGQIENCGEISISCDVDLTTLVPTLIVGEGICSCNRGANLVAISADDVDEICFGDSIQRSWFIDVNNNGIQETEEPDCEQTLIVNVQDEITLSCSDYTIACTEQNPSLVPPTINSGSNCQCQTSEVILLSESGAEDGCVGDTLFREWYADINGNGTFDQNEAQCIQNIILVDDNALVTFDCQPLSVSCTTDPQSLEAPAVNIESSCGCMEFVPVLFRDGLSDTLCVGDTTSRMWFIDLDADNFADEDEPYCLQSITIISDGGLDLAITSDTTNITCATIIDNLVPAGQSMQGICACEENIPFLLLHQVPTNYCTNDTIRRQWVADINQNNSIDPNETIFTQVLVVDATEQDIEINCTDQFVNCQFDQVPAQLPEVSTGDNCSCSDIQVLIQTQFGAEDRCVGDTLFRVWFADVDGDNNFGGDEPTCTQNIILQDSEAMVSFQCDNVSISCQTVADSIPIPSLMTESGCGCMDIQPTLLSDGSLAGICFGESFTREWFVDMNNDGIPQQDEASCRQVITVDGSMSDMTFNCQEQFITCLDTLANIAPPEINTVGICTCNQFDLSIAEVEIDGSVCVGDTIIQRWFVDSNPNNQFDSLDISCDQMLILQGEAQADFFCADVPIDCEADIDAIPPPAILGAGLCSCTELPTILISQSDTTGQRCIGDEIEREWYLDMNSDSIQDDDDPVCVQRFIIIGQNDNFEFQSCDTIELTCMANIDTLAMPTISAAGSCSCDTIQVLELNPMQNAQLCSMDTIIRQFYGDTNNDNEFNDGEPTCEQIIIVENTSPSFDPFTIKWPNIFTGETFSGKELSCDNDTLIIEDEFITAGEAFNCMPQDFDSRPYWCDTECGLITYSVLRDTVDAINACFTIRNTFTIIDWCTYDPAFTDTLEVDEDEFEIIRDLSPGDCLNCPDNGAAMQDSVYFRYEEVEMDGVYQFVQEVSVQDDEPPIVTVMQDTVFVNISAIDTTMSCTASVDIIAEAMDMCDGQPTSDEMIQWTIRIVDENRVNVPNPGGPTIENALGGVATVNSRNGMPGDTFSIVWTVRDGCNAASIRETQVIFFDSLSVCDTMSSSAGIIAGNIHTESGAMIENAMVALNKGNHVDIDYDATNPDGAFAFYNNAMHHNYKLNVSKEDSFVNGISTVDLILIHNHIIGNDKLESPYKIIAADANDDQKLSVHDIAEIKKLILQSTDSFSNNDSWRFLKESQQFFDESIPWPFVEESNIVDLQHDMMDENFIGIKIGDVNGDAIVNMTATSEIRSIHDEILEIEDQNLVRDQVHTLEINSDIWNNVQGIQGTFDFADLDIIDVKSGILEMTNADYYIDNNLLTFSAHKTIANQSKEIFSITVKARQSLTLSESIHLHSEKTVAQIYLNNTLDIYNPVLTFTSPIDFIFEVAQNKPNPFSYDTTIDITLPKNGETVLSIFNVTGQLVYQSVKSMQKGKNSVDINADLLPNEGLYTYIVEFEGQNIIKKMLLID